MCFPGIAHFDILYIYRVSNKSNKPNFQGCQNWGQFEPPWEIMSPDFFWLRWPKRPTRHTIGKKDQNLSSRPIKAVNGTRKSQNRPKRPKIGQQVRIQSGRKCWPPSIPLKLLTFFGIPYIALVLPKPIPLIFCCSWRKKFFCIAILNYNV